MPGAPTVSDCCSNHSPGTGCDDQTCEDLICGSDPFCCFYDGTTFFGWDDICAEEANSACEVCGGSICGGSTHNCCQASSGPPPPDRKCNDPDCCGLICEIDPVCCVVEWDANCRDEAKALCSTCWNFEPGDCCTEHAAAGCNVESCAQAVCANDPDCCDIAIDDWGSSCVAWAFDVCAPSACPRTLTVTKLGTGTGSVTDTTPGGTINCPGDCTQSYDYGTAVTLSEAPAGGSAFGGWGGDCASSGTNTTCDLTMDADHSASATFNPGDQTLNVTVGGAGTGTVTDGIEGDIACSEGNTGTCTDTYPFNSVVALTATATGSSTFTGWTGEAASCGLTNPCNVTMSEQRDVTASFQPPQTLNVTVANGVGGTVTGTGIDCPGDCTQDYAFNTVVTLTRNITAGWAFAGWSGEGSGCGTNATCNVTMSEQRDVTATFDPVLSVTKAGTGTGSISDGAGFVCSSGTCTKNYPYSTSVSLSATPTSPSTFAGWSGDGTCTGSTTPCGPFTMDQPRAVTGTFDPPPDQTLNVTVVGGGSVTDGTEGDINCSTGPSGTCSDTYPYGTVVTLTRVLPAGWVFSGWSGHCAGTTATCQVTMDQARGVTATFAPVLTVTKAGAGLGSITDGAEGDVNCPGTCTDSYALNTAVTLTATPTAPSTFAGWTGDGTGSGTRNLTMNAPKAVTGTFDPGLSVTIAGTGSGTVTDGAEGDINCSTGPSGTCSDSYATNTSVTLTAVAAGGSIFTGWSGGGCAGTGTCILLMDQVRSVTATFQPLRTLEVTISGGGSVTDGIEGDISCSSGQSGTCSDTYSQGTVVTLTRAVTEGWVFVGWSGDCSGTAATCQVTMSVDRDVTASFQPVLTVSKAGGGTGTVTDGAEGDINCGATCSDNYPIDTVVSLSAAASAPSEFAGWSGAGTGAVTRNVTMSAPQAVTATFDPGLAVTVTGDGTGTVTDGAEGSINCSEGSTGTCADSYSTGTAVTLTAAAGGGSVFAGWTSGDCAGTNPVCNLTLSANRSATAAFECPRALSVAVVGDGSVADTTPGGTIACPGDCAESYAYGTSVSLAATPTPPAVFSGWSGDCSGTGACNLTLSAAHSVTATFGAGGPDIFDDDFELGDLCAWTDQVGGPTCPP